MGVKEIGWGTQYRDREDSYEHGHETSGSIKSEEFLDCGTVSISQSTILPGVVMVFCMAQQLLVGQGLLIIEASRSHSDTPHSVGLLWTSDQPAAETST